MRLWPGGSKAGWLWDSRDLPRPSLSAVFSIARLTTPPLAAEVGSPEVDECKEGGETATMGMAPGVAGGDSDCPSCAMSGMVMNRRQGRDARAHKDGDIWNKGASVREA